MHHQRLFALFMIVLAAAASRLLPHPENVAPIAAMALFGGAKCERTGMAFVLPALALFLSDALIGFYENMAVVYLAFALVVCLGFTLRRRESPAALALASVTASALFFLVTNFAPLTGHGMYAATWEGVTAAYAAGLPFLRNTLLGDGFYTAMLFGGFALAERRFHGLRLRPLAPAPC